MTSYQPDVPKSPAPSYTLVSPQRFNDNKEPDSDVISLASSSGSGETTIADLEDLEIDAQTVLSALNNLLTIQRDIVDSLEKLHHGYHQDGVEIDGQEDGDAIVNSISKASTSLFAKSKSLHEAVENNSDGHGKVSLYILTGYRKAAPPPAVRIDADAFDDNALDMTSSIYKWSSDCLIAILALQADVGQLLDQDLRDCSENPKDLKELGVDDDFDDLASTTDSESWSESMVLEDLEEAEIVVTLHRHGEVLRVLTERVDDLLSVFDIAVANYNFSPAPTPITSGANYTYRTTATFGRFGDSSAPQEAIAKYPKAVPETPYTLLRRELYALKDQLKHMTKVPVGLMRARLNGVSPEDRSAECYKDLSYAYTTIEELLSNNGEDWLASEKDGRMSFATFQNLNRDWIYQLRVKLELESKIQKELEQQAIMDRGTARTDAEFKADEQKLISSPDRLSDVLKEILVMLGDRKLPLTTDGNGGCSGVDSDRIVERLAVLGDW